MGVYGGSTFFQGEPNTPPAHPAPPTSNCVTTSSIGDAIAVPTNSTTLSVGFLPYSTLLVLSRSSSLSLIPSLARFAGGSDYCH